MLVLRFVMLYNIFDSVVFFSLCSKKRSNSSDIGKANKDEDRTTEKPYNTY